MVCSTWQFKLPNIPMPISINQAYKNIGFRGRAKSEAYTKYCKQFFAWANMYRKEIYACREFLKKEDLGHIKLELEFRFKKSQLYTKDGNLKKLDASNRIKVIEDLLASILHIDDCEIFMISAIKLPTKQLQHCNAVFSYFNVYKMDGEGFF